MKERGLDASTEKRSRGGARREKWKLNLAGKKKKKEL